VEPTADLGLSYRHLLAALVPVDLLDAVLQAPGGIGHDVSASGPHPSPFGGAWDYSPRFWVFGGEQVPEGLEPLAVSWRSGSHFVLLPDQGFLMTYGLVPRVVSTSKDYLVHWDDAEAPHADVV